MRPRRATARTLAANSHPRRDRGGGDGGFFEGGGILAVGTFLDPRSTCDRRPSRGEYVERDLSPAIAPPVSFVPLDSQ